jgi:regulator of protease activity HflC (stomatin/prohibitin superfamily)
MNSALGRVFDTLLNAINLFRFWVVLDAFEQGIILRLGKFHRGVGPGFHWRRPFNIDRLLWLNTRKKTTDSWEMTLTTRDGQTFTISFDMIMEVIDAEKALLNVDDWVHVSYTTAKIIISNIVENSTYQEVLHSEFAKKIHMTVNDTLYVFGINVTSFGLTDKASTRAYKLFMGAGK